MRPLCLVSVAAVMALSSTASAQEPAPADHAKGKDKVVCKTFPETGSRLRRTRICKTRWQEQVDQDRARRDFGQTSRPFAPERSLQPF